VASYSYSMACRTEDAVSLRCPGLCCSPLGRIFSLRFTQSITLSGLQVSVPTYCRPGFPMYPVHDLPQSNRHYKPVTTAGQTLHGRKDGPSSAEEEWFPALIIAEKDYAVDFLLYQTFLKFETINKNENDGFPFPGPKFLLSVSLLCQNGICPTVNCW